MPLVLETDDSESCLLGEAVEGLAALDFDPGRALAVKEHPGCLSFGSPGG